MKGPKKGRKKTPKVKIKQADWVLAKSTKEWFLLMLWKKSGCHYISELADNGHHRTMDRHGEPTTFD